LLSVIFSLFSYNDPLPTKLYTLSLHDALPIYLTKEGAPMIWKHVPAQPPEAKPIACCDLVNRGLAYHPSGKLFIELLAEQLDERSEEHTSELQSRSDLVCRLLLEKKKKNRKSI